MRTHKSTIYTEDTSFVLLKYFEVTPANNSVKYFSGTMRHQYLTTSTTIRDGKANYYIFTFREALSSAFANY